MAEILDGKLIGERIRGEIASGVQEFTGRHGFPPGLAVVLVGENEASRIYVRNKTQACQKVGIAGGQFNLPENVSPATLLAKIEELNADPKVHGILVQLPLPKALAGLDVMLRIAPDKDVDGLHPLNVGKLVTGRECLRPCTPHGIMKMLESVRYPLEGKTAVIVGRSNIVGKPIGMMLLEKNATVTYCHSRTPDLPGKVAQADVVIAAVGVPELVKGDWIKPGAAVIDVGINRREGGKLVGDVEFSRAAEKAAYITPVPGGVGPMTITMLLWNTLEAARRSVKR
jgi:methylenetetrahydrofolate dehydrogenase (NADP+)/methenyltetrahydrofolate cyclohydrolase